MAKYTFFLGSVSRRLSFLVSFFMALTSKILMAYIFLTREFQQL